jgi:hypothetical protein
MNPETKTLPPSQAQLIGSVESTPLESVLIQFSGHRQTCGFPKSDFQQSDFILTEIRRQHPNRPPQELRLLTPEVMVTLVGWRLNLLPELLANGKVNFIRAVDGASAKVVMEEPLVCSIHIFRHSSATTIALLPSPSRP